MFQPTSEPPQWMIVVLSNKPVAASPDPEPIVASPKPLAILHPRKPKPATTEPPTEGIASRTRSRHKITTETNESIAERVKQCTRETANPATELNSTIEFTYTALENKDIELVCPVLNPKTGTLLEYS
jgi:hypothetical protein